MSESDAELLARLTMMGIDDYVDLEMAGYCATCQRSVARCRCIHTLEELGETSDDADPTTTD